MLNYLDENDRTIRAETKNTLKRFNQIIKPKGMNL